MEDDVALQPCFPDHVPQPFRYVSYVVEENPFPPIRPLFEQSGQGPEEIKGGAIGPILPHRIIPKRTMAPSPPWTGQPSGVTFGVIIIGACIADVHPPRSIDWLGLERGNTVGLEVESIVNHAESRPSKAGVRVAEDSAELRGHSGDDGGLPEAAAFQMEP